MKKNIKIIEKLKFKKNVFLSILILSIFLSCSSDSEIKDIKSTTACDSTNTTFNQLYTQTAIDNFDEITLDTSIHSYTFEVLTSKNICSIGYQSYHDIPSTPYHIEIFNNTTNSLTYSSDLVFSGTHISYVNVGSIPLIVGNSYTIKRFQNNFNNNAINCIGRVITSNLNNNNDRFSMPLQLGDLKITRTDSGIPEFENMFLPYIDMVFE